MQSLNIRTTLRLAVASLLLTGASTAFAMDVIASPGVLAPIDVTLIDPTAAEFTAAGATDFLIDNGHPNTAQVWALHRADGIYLRMEVSDDSANNSDTVFIYLDLDHDESSSLDEDDWGIEISRDGNPVRWGPGDQNSSTWTALPPANFSISNLGSDPWIFELRVDSGALDGTHTLDFTTDGGRVGVYFQIFSLLEDFMNPDPASVTYNQWPDAIDNLPFDDDPSRYGDYEFDPASTFPDIAITDVRNGYDGAENYRVISKSEINDLEVRVTNNSGTVLGDAEDVRINLYLAARGIGESWHRVDEETVLDDDCSNFSDGDWPALDFTGVTKAQVCNGTTPHPDVGGMNPNDIINNMAEYTVHSNVNRVDGESVTIAEGSSNWIDIVNWDTSAAQDAIYSTHGTTRLDHQCMKAEAIYPSDPNPTDNVRQINMDFVCLPEFQATAFNFLIGSAEFSKYDPAVGKEMFLSLTTQNTENMDIGFELKGAEPVGKNSFVTKLVGERSNELTAIITAPSGNPLGRPLKENLMVPAQAGGLSARGVVQSGQTPVYAKVEGGSRLLISHFSINMKDVQYVDLDGRGKSVPRNGPSGLQEAHFENYIKGLGDRVTSLSDDWRDLLLVPQAPLGALVGSFDNFRTGFLVGDGVEATAPNEATHLALGINGAVGFYSAHSGPGFRVKITDRTENAKRYRKPERRAGLGLVAAAHANQSQDLSRLDLRPIGEVMPTLCLEGYENTEQVREIDGSPKTLHRYIGNVCWGVLNVFPRDRSDVPDRSDTFEEPSGAGCNEGKTGDLGLALMLSLLGLALARSTRTKAS